MGENTIGAAQAAVPNTPPAEGNPTGAPAGEGEKKTYTKEEVEQLLQQEADRRVNEAMQRAKRQKEAAVKEAEKLAAMSAEQKARKTYDNILRISDDPDVNDAIRFLREREVVHFQRFGEAIQLLREKLDQKNVYYMNPALG